MGSIAGSFLSIPVIDLALGFILSLVSSEAILVVGVERQKVCIVLYDSCRWTFLQEE